MRATTGHKLWRRCGKAARAGLMLAAAGGWLAPAALRADEADEALKQYSQPVDEAIDKALEYLASHQEKNGSFQSGMPGNTGITALSVMAFLSKGYTPGTGPYGEAIDKGIDYVLSCQQANGMLVRGSSHGPMYSHCIATLMLSEVSGMVDTKRQERLDEVLGQALRIILAAQRVIKAPYYQGGWRYQHSSRDSDISLTGWALMSLRSARGNGADIPRSAIEDAVRFVMNCRRGEGFAYQPGGSPGLARTGTALLCLELCGLHGDKVCRGAGEWIRRNMPRSFGGDEGFFYYGLYYSSQGMFQLGGEYWRLWAEYMYKIMLKHQRKDGSWPAGAGNEGQAGPCYSTAMGVLAMSVSYRQLPIYQR